MTTIKRKPLSKRTRFEIFKRDGFRCLYCGATPNQKPLHVDHVKPVAEGGTNDHFNLATSCSDCNAGKGPVPLEQRKYAASIASEAEKEQPEQIREWLKLQADLDGARDEVVDELLAFWEREVGDDFPQGLSSHLRGALKRDRIEHIREAIEVTGRKGLYRNRQIPYFYGVLRRLAGRHAPEATPEQKPGRSQRADRVQRHLVAWANANPGNTINDLMGQFYLAAWGLPLDLEIGTEIYNPGVEFWRCRNLCLQTKSTGDGKISWSVIDSEDDVAEATLSHLASELALLVGRLEGVIGIRDPIEQAKGILAEADESTYFIEYLRTGDETALRECRASHGWVSPKWLVP